MTYPIMKALGRNEPLGMLHIDAHADTGGAVIPGDDDVLSIKRLGDKLNGTADKCFLFGAQRHSDALYLRKPAPFCIFDEVDAPLDDANINKFNRIIKKFSEESQFIIVTHNKLTMAAVDTIYGVHMAEQGVSAVTPVDFRDWETSGVFKAAQEA